MLVAETLAGLPAVFIGRHAKTEGRVESLDGRELRVALADIPAPATEVRVALQTAELPLGTVQLQGRIVSAFRAEGQITITVQVVRIFAPTDEDFLVTFVHRFMPDERVLGRQFRATPAGTVYELPPPGSVEPLPPDIREVIAAHHGHIDHTASQHRLTETIDNSYRPRPRPFDAPHTQPGFAAKAPTPELPLPPPDSRGVSRQLVDATFPVRIPLLAHLDGIPFLGVAYRVTDDGLRCFVASLGRAPGFGARVLLDLEIPSDDGPRRFRVVGAVAWTLGPDHSALTTAFALRLGPGTAREAMTQWLDLARDELRHWREHHPAPDPDEQVSGLPPADVVAALEAEAVK
jgi:hypothetical protein